MIHVILEVLAYLVAEERTINERTNLDSDLTLHESECVSREAGSPFCSQGGEGVKFIDFVVVPYPPSRTEA